jgi:hypothetical protein
MPANTTRMPTIRVKTHNLCRASEIHHKTALACAFARMRSAANSKIEVAHSVNALLDSALTLIPDQTESKNP